MARRPEFRNIARHIINECVRDGVLVETLNEFIQSVADELEEIYELGYSQGEHDAVQNSSW
jgi:hypothetical protein